MVIDPATLSGDKVVFGATVHLRDEHDNKIKYQIVGETEADARIGRISYASPLGRALIGRMKGEEVEFSAPSGDKYYEIKKIEFARGTSDAPPASWAHARLTLAIAPVTTACLADRRHPRPAQWAAIWAGFIPLRATLGVEARCRRSG